MLLHIACEGVWFGKIHFEAIQAILEDEQLRLALACRVNEAAAGLRGVQAERSL